MQRTTVYLDEDVSLSIRRLAQIRQLSQAEIIRQALHEFVERAEEAEPIKLPRGVGAYSSGRADISSRADELLRRAARKKK
jgi:predicted transcriptional regulator